ncbi:Papilin [Amphibalanus amphitrite]|uniref:Papilin n=2 Tax=Amphibalanus amphitrite TaxID=1232801 RepID=A0A6A4W6D1_AMPAM|nr:Papilin [Amphibalanus amphitrite]
MQLGLLVVLAAAASATVKEEPCQQPLKIGPCDALVPRWYFSAKQGRCLKFNWGGCDPNGNNFESLKDCEKQCCARGCGKPCEQPLKVGPCRAAIPRFYYSAKDGKCMEFSWGGCDPNGNNFMTLADCNKQCNPCLRPKKVGPCKARMPRYYFSTKENRCLKFYWGGCDPNGNNFESLKDCQKQCCASGCGKPCEQPLKVGPCRAAIPRFYYSAKDGKCMEFSWGGCDPNGNNFMTLADCNKQCNPCLRPKKVGPCKARMPRYYFSAKANRCLKFYWGGCDPNGNNFGTLSECRQRCGAGRPKLCRLPKVVGPCLAAFPRYYFNGKRCAKFTYGGCGGNANNFRTVGECRKTCRAQSILVSTELLIKQLTSADKQPKP